MKNCDKAEAEQTSASAEQAVSQSEEFDFLSGGRELDMWYTFDDFKLNIKGICADEMTAYVLFDIVFSEDFDYQPKEGWTEWETYTEVNAVDESLDEQPELRMFSTWDEGVISCEDNILHCYVMPMLSEEYSMRGKTLTLDFEGVWRYVPSHSESEEIKEREILSFGENRLHVEIPIDFPIFETTTWEIDQPIDLSAVEYNADHYDSGLTSTVKYFSATPLSWRVYVETDTSSFAKGDCYYFDTSFDIGGTSVGRVRGHGYFWDDDNGQGEAGLFPNPVDPADITSVTICGHTFELK